MWLQNQAKLKSIGTETAITTTLYDLVAALHDDVDQDADELITATVVNLIGAGRLTFLGDSSVFGVVGGLRAIHILHTLPTITAN